MMILNGKRMKIIKDPVHGYVEVPVAFLSLLDSPPVQRLRYIRQLGFSHLVYPGANHMRFEHSLGTMHLAAVFCRTHELAGDEGRTIMAAGLLHDIGHGPYSHATEQIMQEYLNRSHHHIEHLLLEGETAELLTGLDIDPRDVCAIVRGEHPLAGIIHSDLDVDRMDYLLRDAHYTGVPYGTVDAHRLIRHSILTDDGTVLDENGINAAESLLIARTLMRPAVYFHHVSRIAESMVKAATVAHLDSVGQDAASGLISMDDAAFLQELLRSPDAGCRELVTSLYRRRLYKRAIYVGTDQVNPGEMDPHAGIRGEREIARSVAEAAGIDPGSVIVDIPRFPSIMSMGVQVRNQHDLIELERISPLMKTLNETRRKQWRVGVYAPAEHRSAVSEAATEILHVKRPTRQDKLIR
jgi:HD superfamily phosphohydrolase